MEWQSQTTNAVDKLIRFIDDLDIVRPEESKGTNGSHQQQGWEVLLTQRAAKATRGMLETNCNSEPERLRLYATPLYRELKTIASVCRRFLDQDANLIRGHDETAVSANLPRMRATFVDGLMRAATTSALLAGVNPPVWAPVQYKQAVRNFDRTNAEAVVNAIRPKGKRQAGRSLESAR